MLLLKYVLYQLMIDNSVPLPLPLPTALPVSEDPSPPTPQGSHQRIYMYTSTPKQVIEDSGHVQITGYSIPMQVIGDFTPVQIIVNSTPVQVI